jgi:hypothetical protein
VVLDIEFEPVLEKHRRASVWAAVILGESDCWSPEQENATGAPFRLARNPESVPIATDEKQRDWLAQCARVRPTRKPRDGRGRRLKSVVRVLASDDKANAAQGRLIDLRMCSRSCHHLDRPPDAQLRSACLGRNGWDLLLEPAAKRDLVLCAAQYGFWHHSLRVIDEIGVERLRQPLPECRAVPEGVNTHRGFSHSSLAPEVVSIVYGFEIERTPSP